MWNMGKEFLGMYSLAIGSWMKERGYVFLTNRKLDEGASSRRQLRFWEAFSPVVAVPEAAVQPKDLL